MMLIIGLVVMGLLVLGGAFWIGIGVLMKSERDQKKAEQNAEQILDTAFDGRPDVTFKLHWGTVKYETVVLGAKERGYKLAHENGDPNGAMTLLFEKV